MKYLVMISLFCIEWVFAQPIDRLAITVCGQGRQYVFTNKEAGTYYGEVNNTNAGGWQGWYINAEKILHDYSVSVNGNPLDRTQARSVVLPYQLIRTYAGGVTETVTFLDSVNVLMVEITGRVAYLSVQPAESFIPDSSLAGPLQWWRNIGTASAVSTQYIATGAFDRNNGSVFFISAGQDPGQIRDLLNRVRRNPEKFILQRKNRMQNILNRSTVHFNDQRLTKALAWAKIQIDALIMNQSTTGKRTKGIFAGLPWFNNYWGRDSFIALPGATYVIGNFNDAREILLSYAAFQEKDTLSPNYGRIPNLATPQSVIFNTADGTPWFVRSMYEYVYYSGDTSLIRELYPVIVRSIDGTLRYHTDTLGFLTHGDAETWMDAVGPDGPWSPRGNRANDIQALWYHQLMIGVFCADYLFDYAHASDWKKRADLLESNFRTYFINPAGSAIYDHLHASGIPSAEIRPNQLFTIDMPIPEDVRQHMVKTVLQDLVYEHGTATLAQTDTNFHPYHEHPPYYVKDAAYHNGTVWTWLNGPMIYAATRYDLQDLVFPVTKNSAHQILDRGCVGALSELLDVFPPHTDHSGTVPHPEPKLSGTYSQAWSLSEFVRSLYQDYIGISVDEPSKHIRLNPKLPHELTSFDALQQVGKGSVRVSFAMRNDSVTVTIHPRGLETAFGVAYLFVYANGDAVNAPVELLPHSDLIIIHTRSTVTVLHGKKTIFHESDTPNIFMKNFSDKKYFAGVALASQDLQRTFRVLRGPSHPLLTRAQVRAEPSGASILFSVKDPIGDDRGEHSTATYPLSAHFKKGILDLSSAQFSYDAQNLYCTLSFADLYDPGWHPEYGFQLTLAAIAINTGAGTQREIGFNSHARLDSTRAFDRLIVVGGGIRVLDAHQTVLCEYLPRSEDAVNPIGNVKAKTIEFAIPLEYLGTPKKEWKITLFVGAQDDHGGAGIGEFRTIDTRASEWQGGGRSRPDESNVYDVLLIN